MAFDSTIEWTQTTWNPVVGCRKVSEGCRHCYAERMARRLAAIAASSKARGQPLGRTGNYARVVDRKGRWNGRVVLSYEALQDPFSWSLPRTIFVNSMSDLFHEDVPLRFIRRVFEVMRDCPQHTFQVLTKRPHIAAKYSDCLEWSENVWLGTSVEDKSVTYRAAELRRTRAQTKFLSVEPLLGPIPRLPIAEINWVIVGGESGPGARPMHPDWVRQIRDRCINNDVPFFFKQWGGVNKKATGRELDQRTWDDLPSSCVKPSMV